MSGGSNLLLLHRRRGGAAAPSISYAGSPFTWYQHFTEVSVSAPTNTGGPVVSFSVSPALPTGVSLNTSTGAITGTPTVAAVAANYTVTANGLGGTVGTAVLNITVSETPLIFGSSLKAWLKADAGVFTDAAAQVDGISQHFSKSSPTFAPTTAMAIRFSFKPNGAALGDILGRWTGSTQFIVRCEASGSLTVFISDNAVTDGGNNYFTTTDPVFSDGVTAEVVVVYDGSLSAANRVAVYAGGVAFPGSVTGAISSTLTTSTAVLYLGGVVGISYRAGLLSHVGIAATALSGAALTAAHDAETAFARRSIDYFSYFPLCESTGTRNDVGSLGTNHLTAVNSPGVAAGHLEIDVAAEEIGNCPVKRWEDESGNAVHFSQATIASQPLYVLAGQNGKPVLRGDGSDDRLETAAYSDTGTHVYMACMSILKSSTPYPTLVVRGSTGQCELRYHDSTLKPSMICYPNSVSVAASAVGVDEAHVLSGAIEESAASYVRVDGALAGSDATAGTVVADNTACALFGIVGGFGVQQANADLGEVVIVQSAVAATAPQVAAAEAYLKSRWGTP